MNLWRYDGQWSRPAELPFPELESAEWEDTLAAAGFTSACSIGGRGVNDPVCVWEHRDRERWWMELTFNAGDVYEVEVIGLPNLIELMAKLSTIALAMQAAAVNSELGTMMDLAHEDAHREHRRRYPRRPSGA